MPEQAIRTDNELFRECVPLLAGVVVLLAILSDPGAHLAQNVVAAATVVPFALWAWWERLPILLLVLLVGAADVYALSSGELEPLLFLMSLAAMVIGAWESSWVAAGSATALAVATPFVTELVAHDQIAVFIWMMGIALPLLLGRVFRAQVSLTSQLAAARHELADRATLDERRRIARDMHDLVGHGLAAVMLQVTGARHVLHRDPAAADDGLADAEEIGRRSLQELRHTLSLLRSTDETGVIGPLPGAAEIRGLTSRTRDTGLDVTFRSEGDLGRVRPAVGLSLHRVAEEALVNARRHAPDAVTDVVLTVNQTDVVLSVETLGVVTASEADDSDRPRYGLIGMRERMVAVGGQLDVGPTQDGWRVWCRAPLSLDEA